MEQNITSLTLGENQIQVEANPVDGIQTAATATLQYDGEIQRTSKPKVVVKNANGETHSKSIPSSALTDGKLYDSYTTDLPGDWFSSGKNVVMVKTSDSTQVVAKVEGSGVKYQSRQFKISSTVTNATAS